ncbi:unnamed protein product [marine sediment metagenome]|uniref:Protein GrpE n=1 Tax=marine sediment metagenome TaxID=412755 RepID=X0ZBL5_9ZZZZ
METRTFGRSGVKVSIIALGGCGPGYEEQEEADKAVKLAMDHGINMKKGFEMLLKNFEKLLREEGVEPMDCEGEKFDPFKHEALMVEECDGGLPENVILEELHKGFMYKDKVLRPTKVKISKKKRV